MLPEKQTNKKILSLFDNLQIFIDNMITNAYSVLINSAQNLNRVVDILLMLNGLTEYDINIRVPRTVRLKRQKVQTVRHVHTYMYRMTHKYEEEAHREKPVKESLVKVDERRHLASGKPTRENECDMLQFETVSVVAATAVRAWRD